MPPPAPVPPVPHVVVLSDSDSDSDADAASGSAAGSAARSAEAKPDVARGSQRAPPRLGAGDEGADRDGEGDGGAAAPPGPPGRPRGAAGERAAAAALPATQESIDLSQDDDDEGEGEGDGDREGEGEGDGDREGEGEGEGEGDGDGDGDGEDEDAVFEDAVQEEEEDGEAVAEDIFQVDLSHGRRSRASAPGHSGASGASAPAAPARAPADAPPPAREPGNAPAKRAKLTQAERDAQREARRRAKAERDRADKAERRKNAVRRKILLGRFAHLQVRAHASAPFGESEAGRAFASTLLENKRHALAVLRTAPAASPGPPPRLVAFARLALEPTDEAAEEDEDEAEPADGKRDNSDAPAPVRIASPASSEPDGFAHFAALVYPASEVVSMLASGEAGLLAQRVADAVSFVQRDLRLAPDPAAAAAAAAAAASPASAQRAHVVLILEGLDRALHEHRVARSGRASASVSVTLEAVRREMHELGLRYNLDAVECETHVEVARTLMDLHVAVETSPFKARGDAANFMSTVKAFQSWSADAEVGSGAGAVAAAPLGADGAPAAAAVSSSSSSSSASASQPSGRRVDGAQLQQIWVNQMRCFPRVSHERAMALLEVYPTFRCMLDAFNGPSAAAAEARVAASACTSATAARLEHKLGRTMRRVFVSEDPDEALADA